MERNYDDMPVKIGMVSLGCPKNQVDAEILMSRLSKEEGFTLSHDPALADVVIINTCGFIESAKQEAIDNILEYITLKKRGGSRRSSSPDVLRSGTAWRSPGRCRR